MRKLRFREIVICLKSHGSKLHGLVSWTCMQTASQQQSIRKKLDKLNLFNLPQVTERKLKFFSEPNRVLCFFKKLRIVD